MASVRREMEVDTTVPYVRGYNKRLEERSTNLLTVARDELGQRSETVRRSNLSAIVRELHADGPLSRSELVARTGLTRSAIRGLIGELGGGGAGRRGARGATRHARAALTAGVPEA
jgi:hypothetical protein